MSVLRALKPRDLALLILAAVLIAGAAVALRPSGDDGSLLARFAPGEGPVVAPVTGTTLDGDRLTVPSERSITVVNHWASWCQPCVDEMAILVAASREYGPRGVEFVGIDFQDQPDRARKFNEEYGVTYPSLDDRDGTILTSRRALVPATVPVTYVIGPDGRALARWTGPLTGRELDSVLADALG